MLNDTQRQIQQSTRELAERNFASRAAEIDRTEEYPWDLVETLCEAGFMGMTIPKDYGGLGLGYLDVVVAIEQIAKVCATMGRITVEANMGAIGAIMAYGSEAQKQLVAP